MNEKNIFYEEKALRAPNGLGILLLDILLCIAAVALIILGAVNLDEMGGMAAAMLVVGIVYLAVPSWLLACGIKVLRPNEALVLTLFGKYIGTLKGEGIFFVNPFCSSVNPTVESASEKALDDLAKNENTSSGKIVKAASMSKKLSLKTMTLNNDKQKINDLLGNPIVIGIAVIWHIEDTAKAVFAVDNYQEFLSIQSDTALRNTVRLYPYDVSEGGGRKKPAWVRAGDCRRTGRGDTGTRSMRRSADRRGAHHYAGLCAGDRGGHAAAPAGERGCGRAQDDCRGRGRYGRNGAGRAERQAGGGSGR